MKSEFRGSPLAFKELKALFVPDGRCAACACAPGCHELRLNEVHCKTCGRGCKVVFGAGEFHRMLTQWLTRAVAVVLLLVACQGCQDPLPEGRVLDAGPALDVIFAALGQPGMEHPAVIGVESNCSDDRGGGRVGRGFWLDGACHGGLTQDLGHAVYVVLAPDGARYSHNLAHEALHWVLEHGPEHGDHAHANPGFQPGGAVDLAKAALKQRPELDRVDQGGGR